MTKQTLLEDIVLVEVLKALGDSTRFQIIQDIVKSGELSCGEVAQSLSFSLSQPTVSHHLKILKDAGVIVVRTEAKHHYLSLNKELLLNLKNIFFSRLNISDKGNQKRIKAKKKK